MYLWHGTYYIYGTICTVYDISPTIYDITTLYPLHQSVIPHIKMIISDSTSTVSLSSHPYYQSYKPHCTSDNTGTIFMISYEKIWHYIHSLWYHTMVWPSHTLYHVFTYRIPVIASIAAELLHTLCWVYHICNMCDLKPTICMASYEFYVTSNNS